MTHATATTLPNQIERPRQWTAGAVALSLIVTLLLVPVAIVALGSGTGMVALPYEMFVLANRMPFLFPAHMITSAIALLLLPIVLATRHKPVAHRILGRVVGAFVVAGGLTALPVALFSDSAIEARAGFFAQGLVWLYLLFRGYAAIRAGNRARHMFYMLAMTAVTTGAVWFRLFVGTAIVLKLPFAACYALASWLGWLLPLSLVVAYRQRLLVLLSPRRA